MFNAARLRLVGWNVAVLIAILGVLGFLIYTMFSANIYSEVDQALNTHANQELVAIERANGLYGALNASDDPSFRTIVTNMSGQVNLSSDCPPESLMMQTRCPVDSMAPASIESVRAASSKGSDTRTTTFRNEPARVLTFTVNSSTGEPIGVVQISRNATGEENALHELRLLLLFGGIVSVLLAGLGSLFLANKALVPIRQAFSRQRQFTADASHELRTPLALIRANAEMLSRHGDRMPDGDNELIEEIIQETDHLNRLVGDLLTLARADSGTFQLSSRPVDFRNLVADVHEDLQRVAESQGIGSSISLNGPVVVQGDEGRLRQLILILMDNALKYTDPGGRVDVKLSGEDGHARLVVSDTGVGIPSKDLPHIFERFYRVDSARGHETGGTGLGLAIARWIVQAHHGNIKVESQVGKGTQFQVDLPAS